MTTASVLRINSLRKINELAALLAEELTKLKNKQALILALSGDLGTGKTTLVRYFLRALGVKQKITSPTFVLIKNYLITRSPNYRNIYHIDCYRIKTPKELLVLGIKEVLDDPRNIVLIEWAEKIRKILPRQALWLNFQHGIKENKRTIRIIGAPKNLFDSINRCFRNN